MREQLAKENYELRRSPYGLNQINQSINKINWYDSKKIIGMSNTIYEYLNELESLTRESIPLGLREVLSSAPCQVRLPTEFQYQELYKISLISTS